MKDSIAFSSIPLNVYKQCGERNIVRRGHDKGEDINVHREKEIWELKKG